MKVSQFGMGRSMNARNVKREERRFSYTTVLAPPALGTKQDMVSMRQQ